MCQMCIKLGMLTKYVKFISAKKKLILKLKNLLILLSGVLKIYVVINHFMWRKEHKVIYGYYTSNITHNICITVEVN